MAANIGRVHRLLRMITLLQRGRGCGSAELCVELGISRRTLFRDLQALRAAGIPCYHERGSGYRLHRSYYLPPVNLTVPETLGLMLLSKAAATQRDRPLLAPALSAIYKLLATVPEPVRSACSQIMSHVSVSTGAQPADDREAAHYPSLQRCVDECVACAVAYRSHSIDDADVIEAELELEPYALHFENRAWHLFAYSHHHREVRMFKLARFTSIRPTGRRFSRPEGFSVTRHLGNAWQLAPEGQEHDIELEFTRQMAPQVTEVRWHPTQRHRVLDDGRCRVTFRVDGLREIAWWVCGYADQVRVIRPDTLRDMVRDMHRAAAAL